MKKHCHAYLLLFFWLILSAVSPGPENCRAETNVFENFSKGRGGFEDTYNFTVKEGRYYFKGDGSNSASFIFWKGGTNPSPGYYPLPEHSNYFKEFNVSAIIGFQTGSSNVGYGFFLCFQKNAVSGTDDYLQFLIAGAGYYYISKIQAGKPTETLINWKQSDVIQKAGENHLSVIKAENVFSFYINDMEVEKLSIEGFPGGAMGLTMSNNTETYFDNFAVAVTALYTKAQSDKAVSDAEAAKDEIIAGLNAKIAEMHTQEEMDAVIGKYDPSRDGKVGLEEAVHALQQCVQQQDSGQD